MHIIRSLACTNFSDYASHCYVNLLKLVAMHK